MKSNVFYFGEGFFGKKILIQYYPNLKKSFIKTSEITPKQLKRLLNNSKNQDFYVLRNDSFRKVDFFNFFDDNCCSILCEEEV